MISIILPYYNGDKFIFKALDSCKNGLAIGAEIIVVFDSLENPTSREIKSQIETRSGVDLPPIRIIQNSSNIGAVRSRRIGLEHARHDYIIFLDQDDQLTSVRLEIPQKLDADLILYETLLLKGPEEICESHPPRHRQIGFYCSRTVNQILATRRQPARFGAITVRKSLADQALAADGGGGEEWEFFMRALSINIRVSHQNQVGLLRLVHGDNLSITHCRERLKHWKSRINQVPLPWIVRQVAHHAIKKRLSRSFYE